MKIATITARCAAIPSWLWLPAKKPPLGRDRRHQRDKGHALAGGSTLNRLELGSSRKSAAHKIHADHQRIEALLARMGAGTLKKNTREVVIDLDATDNPVHGGQEGRYFHGCHDNYCHLPLCAFIGEMPVRAELRARDQDAGRGSLPDLEVIVAEVRLRIISARRARKNEEALYNDSTGV